MKKSLFLMAFVSILYCNAQKLTGNIVEYFGKEHIETTNEGQIIHKFKEGYVIPNTIETGTFFATGDQFAWELYTNNFHNPYKGDSLTKNYGGLFTKMAHRHKGPMPELNKEFVTWQKISVDSTGKFNNFITHHGTIYIEWENKDENVLLLQTSGNANTIINGVPHEGDHYDFAYTLVPFKPKKGTNNMIFNVGRFGYVQASLIKAKKPILFTKRDLTLPSLIIGEKSEKWGAIRVINTTERNISDLSIECTLETGEKSTTRASDLLDLQVRKIPFLIPATTKSERGPITAVIELKDKKGNTLDTTSIRLMLKNPTDKHERTFLTRVDGSVQYYAVTPSSTVADSQALVLSVHGAGVEAKNQAVAYKSKDWCHIACATARRPYGFNWESIGRIDALEVFEDAKKVFKTDTVKSYLTGHSMGGHGTWILGATYPDKWAAIAPCAGYPDIATYGSRAPMKNKDKITSIDKMIERSANEGRALMLKKNYLQSGVYIFHGEKDMVVPTEIARSMRKVLGSYHNDFCYYEYPNGSHWFSNESVDWYPIFDFFKRHYIPSSDSIHNISFTTASPAISSTDYWVTIEQQDHPFDFSNIDIRTFRRKDKTIIAVKTRNIKALKLNLNQAPVKGDIQIALDSSNISLEAAGDITFVKNNSGKWEIGTIGRQEKNSTRYGGFKSIFDNNVVFVYSTSGTKEENQWYKDKAKYDAETFLYKGNGNVDVISDKEFLRGNYSHRNILLYGNSKTNRAWGKLLSHCPITVTSSEIKCGDKIYSGDDLGTYFIYPNENDDKCLIGVIAGTGIKGARSTYPNDYVSGVTGYPDLIIFSIDVLLGGTNAIKAAGYFDNDWQISDSSDITYLNR